MGIYIRDGRNIIFLPWDIGSKRILVDESGCLNVHRCPSLIYTRDITMLYITYTYMFK